MNAETDVAKLLTVETPIEPDHTVVINEMRVIGHKGPRFFVLATIDADEYWLVDHHPVKINNDMVVGFATELEAAHFVTQGRALHLGVFDNMDRLRAAYAQAAAQSPQPRSEPSHDDHHPRRPGRPRTRGM